MSSHLTMSDPSQITSLNFKLLSLLSFLKLVPKVDLREGCVRDMTYYKFIYL